MAVAAIWVDDGDDVTMMADNNNGVRWQDDDDIVLALFAITVAVAVAVAVVVAAPLLPLQLLVFTSSIEFNSRNVKDVFAGRE